MAVHDRPRRPSSYDGPRRVEQCQIDHLDPNPWQARVEINPADLADLASSIRDYGFGGHLEARHNPDDPDGRLQLVFGHRRVAALKLLGYTTVPLVIIERSDQAMMALGFRENYTHHRLSTWEEGMFFHRLQVDEGYTIRGIESLLGLSKGVVQNRLDLVKLPEGSPILEAYRQRTIDMTAANLLRLVTRDMTSEQIDRLVAEVQSGAVSKADLAQMKRGEANQCAVTVPPAPESQSPPERNTAVLSKPVAVDGRRMMSGATAPPPNRFAGLTLGDDSDRTSRPNASTSPPIIPCGRDDEALIEGGLLHPDGTEVAAQPEATQATYRLLHAMKQFVATAEQHLTMADPTSLSSEARVEFFALVDRLTHVTEELWTWS